MFPVAGFGLGVWLHLSVLEHRGALERLDGNSGVKNTASVHVCVCVCVSVVCVCSKGCVCGMCVVMDVSVECVF